MEILLLIIGEKYDSEYVNQLGNTLFIFNKQKKTMAKKIIRLTEIELHSLIKECAQEILNETGGFSLGKVKRWLRDYQHAKANDINFISSPNGKTYDVNKRIEKIKDLENTARERLLSYFAKEPFVFTTELEHSNTHIIQYTVQNIAAIRNNEVLLEGEWFDTDANRKINKRIKVNCDTQSVMYYSPILRSNHAQLNPNTRTRSEWNNFVKELTKLRDESQKYVTW